MKKRQLEKLGFPGPLAQQAKWVGAQAHRNGMDQRQVRAKLAAIARSPQEHRADPVFGELATALVRRQQILEQRASSYAPRAQPAPWRQWGDDLDPQSIQQMENACRLPVTVVGALMPDAHLGYGLPIGGVLATDNAVIPYAVGVDIACRMKMTVLDMPPKVLQSQPDRLKRAIEDETRFGLGCEFKGTRRQHSVLDEDWSISPITRQHRDKAHRQLGTSGSGNHFVEFGILTLREPDLDMEPGEYLALLSHSGSRGTGSSVASHYSRLAMQLHPELPKELSYLAWLDMDTDEGREYWHAMELMGKYAHATHDLIHRHIVKHLGARVVAQVENHHNFAWRQEHEGRRVIVHRKGATPAGEGVLGIIPGSMASPAYVVRGKGSVHSLHSASHGAGRVMSRRQAKQTFRWNHVKDHLRRCGVTVMSAGIDEVPFVYKDIDVVMSQQEDLVTKVARFDPKLVKMAPEGEKAED